MSRRTFPRGVAAGLIVAALSGPAVGQSPNPWRGESAALPTAPAPRAVAPKPTRQLTIGLGFNSVGGLTATVEVRDLSHVPQSAKPAALTTMSRPLPLPHAINDNPRFARPAPAYVVPLQPQTGTDSRVIPVSYYRVPEYMPPPAPLPVQYIPPAAP